MAFQEGKDKLEKLTRLQNLRNDLKNISVPNLAKDEVKEVSWFRYYMYLADIARALQPIFGKDHYKGNGNALIDLVTELGGKLNISKQDADNLKFWSQFNFSTRNMHDASNIPEFVSTGIRIKSVDQDYSLNLKEIAQNPNTTFYHNFFGPVNPGQNDSPDAYIQGLCTRMINTMHNACDHTVTALTDFLSNQEKPKTNVFDYLKGTRTME